jgi:hypothetical protein
MFLESPDHIIGDAGIITAIAALKDIDIKMVAGFHACKGREAGCIQAQFFINILRVFWLRVTEIPSIKSPFLFRRFLGRPVAEIPEICNWD